MTFQTTILHQWPLSTIHDILSLANSTVLKAEIILWCTKYPLPNWWFWFPFLIERNIIPFTYISPVSHLTSRTLTKSNLYLANSLATVVTDPDLYRLLTFHVANLMTLVLCSLVPKDQSESEAIVTFSQQDQFVRWGLVSTSPSRQALCLPFVCCPRLLIQYIPCYLP